MRKYSDGEKDQLWTYLCELIDRAQEWKAASERVQLTPEAFDKLVALSERYDLEPLMGEVYVVVRSKNCVVEVDVQGYRKLADRTGRYDGQGEPQWYDAQAGEWVDVWLDAARTPVEARVPIYRRGASRPTWGRAAWREYVQTDRSGKVTGQWRDRGPSMLAKCAEKNGLKKACPGLFSWEQTDGHGWAQVDDEIGTVEEQGAEALAFSPPPAALTQVETAEALSPHPTSAEPGRGEVPSPVPEPDPTPQTGDQQVAPTGDAEHGPPAGVNLYGLLLGKLAKAETVREAKAAGREIEAAGNDGRLKPVEATTLRAAALTKVNDLMAVAAAEKAPEPAAETAALQSDDPEILPTAEEFSAANGPVEDAGTFRDRLVDELLAAGKATQVMRLWDEVEQALADKVVSRTSDEFTDIVAAGTQAAERTGAEIRAAEYAA